MSRFLMVTLPINGHFGPALPVVARLVSRGHQVWWYAGERFRRQVESAGAVYVPMCQGHDYDDRDLDVAFPRRSGLSDFGQVKFDFSELFVYDAFRQLLDLREFAANHEVDLIVADMASGGPSLLHELGGPRFASIGVTALAVTSRETAPFGSRLMPNSSVVGRARNQILNVLANRYLFRDVMSEYNRRRGEIGLGEYHGSIYEVFHSPYLFLQPTVPEFEYPRTDMSPAIKFVGPLLPDPPVSFTPPDWWDDLAGRTVVHVTQGTWATVPERLIVPAMQALAHEDVIVIATTNGKPLSPRDVPQNARVASYLPYSRLLPHVAVMVTNGGYGGVNFALSHGVPLVVAGTTEEKPEIANRVTWAGAGINLKSSRPGKTKLLRAVRDVLRNPRYRYQAQQIQSSMAKHDGPLESVLLLERLARN